MRLFWRCAQFLVVAEERVRGAGLGQLAARVGRHLAAPGNLRAGLVSWINFIFLPEAVNRCALVALRAPLDTQTSM